MSKSVIAHALLTNLPDFDLFLPHLAKKAGLSTAHFSVNHHHWVTHTPLLWLGVGALLLTVNRRSGEALLLTSLTHLSQDVIDDHLPLLWPVSKQMYGLRLGDVQPQEGEQFAEVEEISSESQTQSLIEVTQMIWRSLIAWTPRYKRSPSVKIEKGLWLGAGIVIAWRLLRRLRSAR